MDCKRFSDYKAGLSCFAIEICLVSMNPTDRYRRSFLFNLVVVKFKYKCHVCVCSLVVVRQVVNYERFRDYKAGLPVGLGWVGLVGRVWLDCASLIRLVWLGWCGWSGLVGLICLGWFGRAGAVGLTGLVGLVRLGWCG